MTTATSSSLARVGAAPPAVSTHAWPPLARTWPATTRAAKRELPSPVSDEPRSTAQVRRDPAVEQPGEGLGRGRDVRPERGDPVGRGRTAHAASSNNPSSPSVGAHSHDGR